MLCIMDNVEGDETEKIVCEVESPVHGVTGIFGFTMKYNPGEATILENTILDLSYSPSPEPATIIVDIDQLIEEYDIPIPNNIRADPPGKKQLPINDVPLGTYTIASIVLYNSVGNLVQLILDVEINSQINTTLETTGGSLEHDYFEWHDWGAEEVTLTPSVIDEYIEVSASFEYYVNLEIKLTLYNLKPRLTPPKIEKTETPLKTIIIPLKEMPFPDTIISKITIDKSHTRIKEMEAELMVANTEIDGLESDLNKANGNINGLQNTVCDFDAENKNLSQELKESTELVLDLSETIGEIDEEFDYSIAFACVGICIALIIGVSIGFVISKKKKREPQPYRTVPPERVPYSRLQEPERGYQYSPEPFPPENIADFFVWEDKFEKQDVTHPEDEVVWKDEYYYEDEYEFYHWGTLKKE